MDSVPTILSAVGTGVGVYGSLKGGREDANASEQQARVAYEQSLRDEEASRRASRQRLGEMAASFAQNGGGIDAGVLQRSALNAELDALNIRYGGEMRRQGLLVQAGAMRRQAKLGAAAKILSGAGDIYRLRNP